MTDMTFKSFFKEKAKIYEYVIKIAKPEIEDCDIDCLVACLKKYDLEWADKFQSTPPQLVPFDFPNVSNMPVHSSKIKLKYPASPEFLQHFLAQTLSLPLTYVVVQTSNDPRIADREQYLENMMPEFKERYVSKLSKSTYEGEEGSAENLTTQKELLLKELNDCRVPNTVVTNNLVIDQVIDQSNLPKDYNKIPVEEKSIGLFGRTVR
jgi:hypothetical protein